MGVAISNQQSLAPIALKTIRRKAQRLLNALGCEEVELSVALVDDSTIAALNAKWRRIDGPTDVLAFPMDEPDESLPHSPLLGDVVISVERALAQAKEAGHSLDREIDLLLVHGVLHLVGYDHEGSDELSEEMALKEAELLRIVG